MKRETFAIVILFLSLIASADFYRPDSVPAGLMPPGYARGRAAALYIDPESNSLGCSATLISSQGHVLTAAHCLPQCLGFKSHGDISNFRYSQPNQQSILSGKANCSISFQQEGRTLGSMRAQVVAAGAGYVEFSDGERLAKELDKDPKKKATFIQLMKAGVGISGDFAIVRVPGLAARTCAQLANRSAQLGEFVWDISYPAPSHRPNGLGAPGGEAVFSGGQVTWVKTSPTNYDVQTGAQASTLRTNRNGIIQSSIDSNEGSSGAGLLSSNGEVLGLYNSASLSLAEMNSSFNPSVGSRNSAGADFIRQYVSWSYSSTSNGAFNCL